MTLYAVIQPEIQPTFWKEQKMENQMRSADAVLKIAEANPARMQALKSDPQSELPKLVDEAKATTPEWRQDKWLYRIAVGVLGALALVTAYGALTLALQDKSMSEALVALGSAAVGGLVGLFAPSPLDK
jgi:hypothetical protein